MTRTTLKLPDQARRIKGQHVDRFFRLDDTQQVEDDARVLSAALSSTEPVERWFGTEILEHKRESVDLSRARPSLPLLFNHNPDAPIGSAEEVRTEDNKLRAKLRFANTERADEVLSLIRDGHIRGVSVGYIINDYVEERGADMPTVRVTKWTLFEASIAVIPADDVGAGIGRNFSGDRTMNEPHQTRTDERRENREAERVAGLYAAGDNYKDFGGPEIARELIKDLNATLDTFNQRVLDKMRGTHKPFATAQPFESPVAYGQGARQILAKPQYFTGPDAERKAYVSGNFIRAMYGKEDSLRWCHENGIEVRAMSAAVLSQGGALVPDELSSTIIDLTATYGAFRQNADNWPMSTDTLRVPKSSADPDAAFVNESGALAENDPSWAAVGLMAKKIGVITRIPTELLEDSTIAVADRTAFQIGRSFAKKEDQCGFLGDGTSTYGGISGIFVKLIDGNHDAGKIVAASGNDVFTEITAADLSKVIGALPEIALDGARWFCSITFFGNVFARLMLGLTGNAVGDVAATVPRFYAGFPVVTSPVLPAGVATDYSNLVMAAFGNLRLSSKFGARRDIRVQILTETYAANDQIGVMATERFDIVNHDLGDNTTAGPMVGLVGN